MFCVHMVYYITRANLLSFLLVKMNCIALFTTLITNHVPYININCKTSQTPGSEGGRFFSIF